MRILKTSNLYVISDTHIAGGESRFASEDELIAFVQDVGQVDGATLVLLGDFLDLWQMEGATIDKLRGTVVAYPQLFEQIREFSRDHDVVFMPGNHDRIVALEKEREVFLEQFGIETLDEAQLLVEIPREGKAELRVVAEHGHETDPYNSYDHPMDGADRSFSEHLMDLIIRPAMKLGGGRGAWIRDADKVSPLSALPWWIGSKYFYREAGLWIKVLAVPAAVLFGLTKVGLVLLILYLFGVDLTSLGGWIPMPIVYALLGFVGIDVFAVCVAIVIALLRRDALHTLRRWGVSSLDAVFQQQSEGVARRASELLEDTGADVYMFGHTHEEMLQRDGDDKLLCNPGTWAKRMHRVVARFHLPPVFVPVYRLTYLHMATEGSSVKIELRARRKDFKPDLTYLERFASVGRSWPSSTKELDVLLAEEWA